MEWVATIFVTVLGIVTSVRMFFDALNAADK